jgi:hypothetical protein
MDNIFFLLMGLCMAIASPVLLAGAAWSYFSQKRKMEERQPAAGTVVELVHRITGSGRGGIYCPVVEFTATSGQVVRFTSEFGSRPAMHRVGQSVDVRYDPADPHKAEINSTVSRWLTPAILVFMGLIGCCLAITFLGVYGLFLSTLPAP